jgi:hypothetical protein
MKPSEPSKAEPKTDHGLHDSVDNAPAGVGD